MPYARCDSNIAGKRPEEYEVLEANILSSAQNEVLSTWQGRAECEQEATVVIAVLITGNSLSARRGPLRSAPGHPHLRMSTQ